MSAVDAIELAGELYALPLAEFTSARDAKAKELKGTPEAAVVKGLRKPSTAAWVVNLFVRLAPNDVEQMLEVGAALRAAQAGLDAGQLRSLTAQRRQLTAAITTRARTLAHEHGLRVSDDVAEQVEQTLTAAMIDESAAAAVRSGLLVAALTATGLDPVDVSSAVAVPEAIGHQPPAAKQGPRRVAKPKKADDDEQAQARRRAEQEAAERRAAEERVAQAEGQVGATREAQTRARKLVKERQARALQVHAEMDEVRRRLAELEASASEADRGLDEAVESSAATDAEVTRAEEVLEEAQAALRQL